MQQSNSPSVTSQAKNRRWWLWRRAAASLVLLVLMPAASREFLPELAAQRSISRWKAPAITSPNAATFTVGSRGVFTVVASGSPTVSAISVVGALPSGVTFTNNRNGTATLAGTPRTGTAATYALTIKASNGVIHAIDSVILPPAAAKVVAAVGSAAAAAGKVEAAAKKVEETTKKVDETAKKAESATQNSMPGFESIFAIAGLLSVAFIACRRRN